MSEETINLEEWVEAIQDVATLEQEMKRTSDPRKHHMLQKARMAAVERVIAIHFLTGATTERLEQILDTEPWAHDFLRDLSEENDDLAQTHTQARQLEEETSDAREIPSWYSGASPFSKAHPGRST